MVKGSNVWASITARVINFPAFSQALDLNICVKTEIKSLWYPSTSFPVHYSLIIVIFNGYTGWRKSHLSVDATSSVTWLLCRSVMSVHHR